MSGSSQQKGMRAFVWTNDVIDDLIDFMEENPILWNVRDKLYHDKDKRKEAMGAISEKLGIAEELIKKKWNALRTQLAQEKSKAEKSRKSGAGVDEIYVPKWMWYEKLTFLLDIVGPKRSISNLPLPGDPEESIYSNSDNAGEDEDQSDNDSLSNVSISLAKTPNSAIAPGSSAISPGAATASNSAKKMKFSGRNKSTKDEELKMLKSATDYLGSLKNKPKEVYKEDKEDEFTTYSRHIANELRQVKNPIMLRLAKRSISNIIFDAQSEILPKPSNAIQFNNGLHNQETFQGWQTSAVPNVQQNQHIETRQFGDPSSYTFNLRNDAF